ncbi:hypothetical protein HanIR_Chr15g0764951 [Helianthus annuus]|nr:hypothetical protein HanIR_Chr15g0764951 [Helianthus annuus]
MYLFRFKLGWRFFIVKTWNSMCFYNHALSELLYSCFFLFLPLTSSKVYEEKKRQALGNGSKRVEIKPQHF